MSDRAADVGGGQAGTDYAAVFAAMPTPYLVLTPDLLITDANPAYLEVTGRRWEDLVGRPVFEAFPANPGKVEMDGGVDKVRTSLERARDSGRPDTMPVQKYDIPDPVAGGFSERFWSLISVPVLDESGRCVLLLQRAEDVTAYVRGRESGRQHDRSPQQAGRRREEVEADLVARGQELRAARDAEAVASRRLASLADVALQLAGAQTVADLTDIVVDSGLAALGADGGAVAVSSKGGDTLHLTITDTLGAEAQRLYCELPLAGPLPACVAAATGGAVLLPDRAASLAWAPEMAAVVASIGCQAWAALPLQAAGGTLGSLTVGWRDPQRFAPNDTDLLAAFAAQCAQTLDRILTHQAEREAHTRVRRLSETLQRSLLTDPPHPHRLQIAVRYLPAAQQAQVGGDWYDAFVLADGSTTLVIGDVAGHDRDAAAAMAQVRNVLRGVAHTLVEPPAAVLSSLDRAMRDLQVGSLATAVLAKIEQTGTDAQRGLRVLHWSNAGHPPPLLLEPDGTVTLLSTEPDLLLGLDPSTPRSDHEQVLRAGATVLLYTDGLVERRGASLDDGFARLRSTVAELGQLPLEELCDALLGTLADDLDDDVALLAIRAHPGDAWTMGR